MTAETSTLKRWPPSPSPIPPLLLSWLNHSCPSVWHQNSSAHTSQTSSRMFFFFFFLMTDWSCSPQCSGSKGLPAPGLCSIFNRLSSWNSRPVRTQGLPLPGHFPQKTSVSLPLLLPPDGPRRLNCSCRLLYLQVFDSRVYIPCIISSFHIPAKYPFFRCVFWLHFRLSKPFSMHESHPRAPGMVHPLVSSFQSPASPSWLITCHIVRKNNYPARAKGWNFRTALIFPPMLF